MPIRSPASAGAILYPIELGPEGLIADIGLLYAGMRPRGGDDGHLMPCGHEFPREVIGPIRIAEGRCAGMMINEQNSHGSPSLSREIAQGFIVRNGEIA